MPLPRHRGKWTSSNEHEIAPYVFPQSVTAFMGIPMPVTWASAMQFSRYSQKS